MKQSLLDIWKAGIVPVRGGPAVERALAQLSLGRVDHVLAVGKAACDMARPALTAYPNASALAVTKHHHGAPLPCGARVIEAGHPIPDASSLEGGRALWDAVRACGSEDQLLLLVSGGASAVAEVLPAGMALEGWRRETDAMVASGADIHAINARRKEVSGIKGGKLLAGFCGARATSLVISDVESDALDVVGSGIGDAPAQRAFAFEAHMIATNADARRAAARAAQEPVICNEECLYDDVAALAPRLGAQLKDGPPGLYIFGGEPTVNLPSHPGRGGRNQALALMMAREIAGVDGIEVLVAGTDGSDGPTGDAGGHVTGATWQTGAEDALRRANAGSYLEAHRALVTTGPTGTNVMDLMIARKS